MSGEDAVFQEQCLVVHHAVVPGAGEDCFAFYTTPQGGYLCVADGCGGLGSKRYPAFGDRTGAYLAAHLVTRVIRTEVAGMFPLPGSREEVQELCASLGTTLNASLKQFEDIHGGLQSVRIVGRMFRAMPTTLCLMLMESSAAYLDCLCLWAGDSRAYLLSSDGLHQLTADHTLSSPDAMENLYKDAPLTNLLSAETEGTLSGRRMRAATPCVAMVATDGAYAYLKTPMEMEWLLLSTLYDATSMAGWQKKIQNTLVKVASDDSTLLLTAFGYQDFNAIRAGLDVRRLALQQEYITPVRRRKADFEYAKAKWRNYVGNYDWTERTAQGGPDWRV